jgi:rare lipoprotein A
MVLSTSCVRKVISRPGNVLTGTASWYGPDFHGKLTSNREIYNMYDLTAAHKTLPFGTRVMVTNMLNGKSVQVRINDRGPFVGERILDLSYAAARLLDLVGPGTAPVRIDILGQASPAAGTTRYSVQVGAFALRQNAETLVRKLVELHGLSEAQLSRLQTESQVYYRVRIPAATMAEAQDIARRLAEAGFQVIVLEE